MITTVKTIAPPTRRGVELALLLFAAVIVICAYVSVDLAALGKVPAQLGMVAGSFVALMLAVHLVVRWKAPYADPLILPIAMLLNGLGVVMIRRIQLAGVDYVNAGRQVVWTGVAVALAVVVMVLLKDHRQLRRYPYLAAGLGIGLLLLPLVPVIGRGATNGSNIWIHLGSMSFQPGELAKIVLSVYFAGYLVHMRDVLSLAGRRVLGIPLPRGRHLGPILIAWVVSLLILVFERDLGSALLFFGIFVVMLYVATERVSWIVIGLVLFAVGAYLAWRMFGHVQVRISTWLDPFPTNGQGPTQLAIGLMGMGAGGLFGTGLGQGRPQLTPLPASDFIFASLAEELGLFGAAAILVLFVVFAERGIRTALGVRDNFGKLLALGLSFSVALQCFIVIGGVTRVIPLTGLTTPFMSMGGSALVANWAIVGILLRISDQARQPIPEARPLPAPGAWATAGPGAAAAAGAAAAPAHLEPQPASPTEEVRITR